MSNILELQRQLEEELDYNKHVNQEWFEEVEKNILESMKPIIGDPKDMSRKVINEFYSFLHWFVDLHQIVFYKHYVKPISDEALLTEILNNN